MDRIPPFTQKSIRNTLTNGVKAIIFWLRDDPQQEKNMIMAKLNCNEMVVQGYDGRVFLVDRRTPERMEAMEGVSPPAVAKEGETTRNLVPFHPQSLMATITAIRNMNQIRLIVA